VNDADARTRHLWNGRSIGSVNDTHSPSDEIECSAARRTTVTSSARCQASADHRPPPRSVVTIVRLHEHLADVLEAVADPLSVGLAATGVISR